MLDRDFKPGEPVIYRKPKHSTHPGPRAELIDPAPRGEEYTYEVDKFWVVRDVRQEDGRVVVCTRRGKTHEVPLSDMRLRHANVWERFIYRNRFPRLST